MKNKSTIFLFILLFLVIAFLLLKDPFIGIADNSDYYRVIQPLGFEPQIENRYFYAYNYYTVNNMDAKDIKGSINNIIDPGIENDNQYFSTQFIFIKIAMIINFLIKVLLGKSPEIFNIKLLGILYAALYSYGLYLLLKNINIRSKVLKLIFIVLSVFILCDIGYIIYFNSFFGEALIIATIMLTAGSIMAYVKSEENSIFYIIFFYIKHFIGWSKSSKHSNRNINRTVFLMFVND